MACIIEWHGNSCVRITVKHDVGEVSLLTDPFPPDGTLKLPRGLTADIVVCSSAAIAKDAAELLAGEPFRITHPGEYEVKGIFVYGTGVQGAEPTKGDDGQRTIYRIEAGDLSIIHLGDLRKAPTDEELDRLADADILLLPVGGHGLALSADDAAEVMTRIEPRVVVPIRYKLPGIATVLDPVEKFMKEAGLAPERVDKLKLAKKDLPTEDTKLYLLNV